MAAFSLSRFRKVAPINSVDPLVDQNPNDVEMQQLDGAVDTEEPQSTESNVFIRWAQKFGIDLGLETRGIRRVEPGEQTGIMTFPQVALMWFSLNTASQNIALGALGNEIFGLGFYDASLLAVFASLLGSFPVAYAATWGAISGNRTMVCSRFVMGWYLVKLCVLGNLVILLGYSMIGTVICGQMLSAVSPNGSLTVDVGIIIAALLTLVVTTFGIRTFHQYERYACIPQLIVLLILCGVAGPHFDLYSPSTAGPAANSMTPAQQHLTIVGNRITFFSLCFSSAITYAPLAADFFVYCNPALTTRRMVFWGTYLGVSLSFIFTLIIGCGLASGQASNEAWKATKGGGALVIAGFADLGGFGKFCGVITALGLISNIIPTVYSSGVDIQVLGRYAAMVPRIVLNALGLIAVTICALAGKDNLSEIFTNFLALMGYWVMIWMTITLEETFIFRRSEESPFAWQYWDSREHMPLGIAAFAAFVIGWIGAIMCMAQVYYHGPIANLVGKDGADLGMYVAFAWSAIVYPPLRYLEKKHFKR